MRRTIRITAVFCIVTFAACSSNEGASGADAPGSLDTPSAADWTADGADDLRTFDPGETAEPSFDVASVDTGDPDGGSPIDLAPEFSSDCPNATAPGSFTPGDLKQSQKIGTTEVDILFRTPLPDNDDDKHLTFEVAFTNHTCSIPGYNDELVGKASVVNNQGTFSDAFTYDVKSKDSHHGAGVLKVARFVDGVDLIGCDTTSLTLTLAEIDGGDPAFAWGEEFLSGLK